MPATTNVFRNTRNSLNQLLSVRPRSSGRLVLTLRSTELAGSSELVDGGGSVDEQVRRSTCVVTVSLFCALAVVSGPQLSNDHGRRSGLDTRCLCGVSGKRVGECCPGPGGLTHERSDRGVFLMQRRPLAGDVASAVPGWRGGSRDRRVMRHTPPSPPAPETPATSSVEAAPVRRWSDSAPHSAPRSPPAGRWPR